MYVVDLLKIAAIVGAVCFTFNLIFSYVNFLSSDAPRLSRDTIKSLYAVERSRLSCENETESYRIVSLHYYDGKEKISFNVNFVDWIWLCHNNRIYCESEQKRNDINKQKQNLEKILETFQRDIKALQDKSEKEIEGAQKITAEVLQKMK